MTDPASRDAFLAMLPHVGEARRKLFQWMADHQEFELNDELFGYPWTGPELEYVGAVCGIGCLWQCHKRLWELVQLGMLRKGSGDAGVHRGSDWAALRAQRPTCTSGSGR